jgi:hypothetical protein
MHSCEPAGTGSRPRHGVSNLSEDASLSPVPLIGLLLSDVGSNQSILSLLFLTFFPAPAVRT